MLQAFWVFDSVLIIIAFILGALLFKWISDKKVGDAGDRARQIVAAAERDAEARGRAADLEAKELALKARGEFDAEVRRREREMQQIEQRALAKDEQLTRKFE
jgi:ribonuclease Y